MKTSAIPSLRTIIVPLTLLSCLVLSARAAYEVSAWSEGDTTSLAWAANRSAIDEVSVDWYVSQRDATVGTDSEDLSFVSAAHGRGLRVLATVADVSMRTGQFNASISSSILLHPKLISKHVAALVDLCVTKGYDGLDIDWEAVKPRNKAKFTLFIDQLATALHAQNKILSMAVAAKDTEPGDWSAAQSEDYAALGASVDEFKVMTYDYSGSWSPPGPISPLTWMDSVLAHAEALVAPEKIMMGVPFYGYDWYRRTAATVNYSDVQSLIKIYNPNIARDASGEATFKYVAARGRNHTVFFQDRTALAGKLQMLRDKHAAIRGIAIWVMGGEDPAFWDEIKVQMH